MTPPAPLEQRLQRWFTGHLAGIYLAISLSVGWALCVLTPPFFGPDESMHSLRAITLSHGEVIAERSGQGLSGGWLDTGVLDAEKGMGELDQAIVTRYPIAHDRPKGRITETQVDVIRRIRWTGQRVFAGFPNTAVYPPALYLPQALGWRLGEAAGWTIVQSLLLARALNVLISSLIGLLALRLCVRGHWLLWAYLLLPTGIGLRASGSQDAVLLALAGLLFVVLSRPIVARRPATIAELLCAAGLLVMCIGARVPYLPLALVLFLPALNLREIRWRDLVKPAIHVALVVGMVGAWQVAVHKLGVFSAPGIDPARQVEYLQAHPVAGSFKIAEGTARAAPGLAIKGLELLGINDVFPPYAIYGALLLAVGAIALLGPMEGLTTKWSRLFLLGLLVVAIAGMSVAEYIIWNPTGSNKVEGLQSRYYMPLLPLAFLLIRQRIVPGDSRWRSGCLTGAGLQLAALVIEMPWIVSETYYRLSPYAAGWAALR